MVGQGRYFITTFGCRVNQADAAGLASDMEAQGFKRTQELQDAEVVVLNTCTVTHRSDVDVRKTVSRIRRVSPNAKVMITGCFAQRDPKAVADLQGVSAVVGNAFKSRLPIIAQELPTPTQQTTPHIEYLPMSSFAPEELPVEPTTTVLDRTRPFVKIQDGCDAKCTYCIIPDVRGPARAAPPQKVLEAIKKLIDDGYFEIVLTGIHLGTYTYSNPLNSQTSLSDLVNQILALPNLGRLRVSCIEPMAFPMELVSIAAKNPKFAPHFHLPLQAGSNRILKRMVRPYRGQDFIDQTQAIRKRLPNGCIGTDVIVGFPGETDNDFEQTISCVKASGVNYVHVFSYSDRHGGTGIGTPSTRLDAKVDPRVIKERSTQLNTLSKELWSKYLDRQLGQTLPALVLESNPQTPHLYRAITDNFCKVDCEDPSLTTGSPVSLKIIRREKDRLIGEVQS